jgi:hypothetical protein
MYYILLSDQSSVAAVGPEVVLSQGEINFHLVASGETSSKALEIINKSSIDAAFQVT